MQPTLGKTFVEAYAMEPRPDFILNGLGESGYIAMLCRAVLGAQSPDETILMEIDPEHQTTRSDFVLTEKMLGVRAVA